MSGAATLCYDGDRSEGLHRILARWVGPLRFLGLGWYVALCIVLGLVAGRAADDFLGLPLLFTVIGLGVGVFAAFWGLYRMVVALGGDDEPRGGRPR